MYHAPADCPVCGDDLLIVSKGCRQCGTEIRGQFASTEFDSLDQAELELLRVFLASRGNMRSVEAHLGVSYPTARSRFDALLTKLGLARVEEPQPKHAVEEEASGPAESAQEEESDVLARVVSGELSPAEAAEILGR